MDNKKNCFLTGPIVPNLIKFIIPLVLSLVIQALYGAIDMMIVGKFATTSDVAAVGVGSLLMQAAVNIITGLSMGVTVILGHAIGAKDNDKAARTVGGLIKLFSIFMIFLSLVMYYFAPEMVKLLNTPAEAVERSISYVRICSCGIIFIGAYNGIAGIFRGIGDSKSPLIFVSIACVTNIIGDLILVKHYQMATAGAAYATVISQGISVIFSVIYIAKIKFPFHFSFNHVKKSGDTIKEILAIGSPIASQDLLNYLSFMLLVCIINALGLTASAAMAIEGKIFAFLIILPMSFMSALSAFVAQNSGANQEDRSRKALKSITLIAMVCGVIFFIATFFLGKFIAEIFSNKTEVIYAAARLLKGAAFEHLIYPFIFCLLGYFNGRKLTTFMMIQGFIYSFLVRVPLAYFLSRNENVDLMYLGLSLSVSAIASAIMCFIYFTIVKKRHT